MFFNHLQLHRSRRIKDEKQEKTLRKLKKYIFDNFNNISPQEFINTLHTQLELKLMEKKITEQI